MRYFNVLITVGTSNSSTYIIYCNSVGGTIATVVSTGLPAAGLTYSQLTSNGGVIVSVPDNTTSIILYDSTSGFCNSPNTYLTLNTPTTTTTTIPYIAPYATHDTVLDTGGSHMDTNVTYYNPTNSRINFLARISDTTISSGPSNGLYGVRTVSPNTTVVFPEKFWQVENNAGDTYLMELSLDGGVSWAGTITPSVGAIGLGYTTTTTTAIPTTTTTTTLPYSPAYATVNATTAVVTSGGHKVNLTATYVNGTASTVNFMMRITDVTASSGAINTSIHAVASGTTLSNAIDANIVVYYLNVGPPTPDQFFLELSINGGTTWTGVVTPSTVYLNS